MKISTIEGNHLIALDAHEALMMVRLLHAAGLHAAASVELQIDGDAQRFSSQLCRSLMQHLGGAAAANTLSP